MTEATTPAVVPAQEPVTPAPVTPPWGDDKNFDPARAWSLIENLKAEKEKLNARPVLTPEQQKQLSEYNTLVEASKTESQRLADAAEAARVEAATAKAETIRYKAAATHGITAEHFDLLGSGTEEEVTARAAKLAALLALQTPAVPPVPGAPVTRPIETLRPGASPADQPSEDDAVYASLFGVQQ